ncbi:UbiA family prenyltransferase [Myxococcota bacterium]|nr:UbiA family prenyltransferase [Myxococcota bacterium]
MIAPSVAELRAFAVHLRLPYQLFILPAGYLVGGLVRDDLDVAAFVFQFFNVHVLLNGGVTVFNSFYDDDDGPIGGLEHPPKLARWTLPASLALQGLGLFLALDRGLSFLLVYALTMIVFAAYSHPSPRWKGRPWLGVLAVGVGTGTNTFLLGYLAGGTGAERVTPAALFTAIGVAALLLAFYPVSQLYQVEHDRRRGDHTFAVAYGAHAVRRWFVACWAFGLPIVAWSVEARHVGFGIALFLGGIAGGAIAFRAVLGLEGRPSEYHAVMRLKYAASISFSLFALVALFAVHA